MIGVTSIYVLKMQVFQKQWKEERMLLDVGYALDV